MKINWDVLLDLATNPYDLELTPLGFKKLKETRPQVKYKKRNGKYYIRTKDAFTGVNLEDM